MLQIDFDADEIVGWAFHPHLLNDDGVPVPVTAGGRFDRISDIIAGDCASHQPPPRQPATTSTTTAPTTTATATTAEIPTMTTTAVPSDTTTDDG